MADTTIEALLQSGLQRLYQAHHQGARQAAANIRTSTSPRLRSALRAGSKRSLAQARRLETVFRSLGMKPSGRHDAVMQGIADANERMVQEAPDAAGRDLVNIASGQVAAHFYLATYGVLRAYARAVGNRKAVKILGRTLKETSGQDSGLTALAQRIVATRPHARPASTGSGLLIGVTGLTGALAVAAFMRGQSGS